MKSISIDSRRSSDDDALLENFNLSWKTNVIGPILTTNAFLPLLKKGSLKKVLTLSTGLGDAQLSIDAESPVQPAYCVSKSALEMVNVKYAGKYNIYTADWKISKTFPTSGSQE